MDLAEFDVLAQPLHQQSAASIARYGLPLIEGRTATADEVADAEQQLGVTFPGKYKRFMMRYGGGQFGFVDLLSVVSRGQEGDDVTSVNNREFPERKFIAVSPVGTGDHWGFAVIDGRCQDEVWFTSTTLGTPPDAADFLEFVTRHGLCL